MNICIENCKQSQILTHVPNDRNSKCIFHSKNEEFRREHNLQDYINAYVQKCVESDEIVEFLDINFIENPNTTFPLILDKKFKKKVRFNGCYFSGHFQLVNCTFDGGLSIQDSSPVRPLVSHISSSEGAEQFDVVEIFLITATATVLLRSSEPKPNRIEFDEIKTI